jgi:hypothetical protein
MEVSTYTPVDCQTDRLFYEENPPAVDFPRFDFSSAQNFPLPKEAFKDIIAGIFLDIVFELLYSKIVYGRYMLMRQTWTEVF